MPDNSSVTTTVEDANALELETKFNHQDLPFQPDPSITRVILSFLDPKKPVVPFKVAAGNQLSVLAEKLDENDNTVVIYVDRKKHFNPDGTLKSLDDQSLPDQFKYLKQAKKVEIHAHGSAGSDELGSDYWAYPLFESEYLSKSKYLSWLQLRSPFPQKFTAKEQVASILKVCENQPSIEILACESAKKGEKGEDSFVDHLEKEVKIVGAAPEITQDEPVVALAQSQFDHSSQVVKAEVVPEKPVLAGLKGHKQSIAIVSLKDGSKDSCKIWVPVTNVEKISTFLFAISPIVPIAGFIVACILHVALDFCDGMLRSVLSPWLMQTEEQVELQRITEIQSEEHNCLPTVRSSHANMSRLSRLEEGGDEFEFEQDDRRLFVASASDKGRAEQLDSYGLADRGVVEHEPSALIMH